MPSWLVDPLALVITVAFTVDVVRSVQEALDLREVLTRLTEENEDLRRLAKRAEVAAAFAEDDLRRFRERVDLSRTELQERMEAGLQQHQEAKLRRSARRSEELEEALRSRTSAKLETLRAIQETLERARDNLEDAVDMTQEALAARRAELDDAIEHLKNREASIRSRTVRTYRASLRILRANPSAKARDFSEVLETLRKLGDRR